MLQRARTIVALAIAVPALAGCLNYGDAQDPDRASARAWDAPFLELQLLAGSDHEAEEIGWVYFVPHQATRGPHGEERQAHLIVNSFTRLARPVGAVSEIMGLQHIWVDDSFRIVRQDECAGWQESTCKLVGFNWDLEGMFNPFGFGLPEAARDGALIWEGGSTPGPADRSVSQEIDTIRIGDTTYTFKAGAWVASGFSSPLDAAHELRTTKVVMPPDSVGSWPTQPHRPSAGPWGNQLYEGAGESMHEITKTPLELLQYLIDHEPSAKATLENGGCITKSSHGWGQQQGQRPPLDLVTGSDVSYLRVRLAEENGQVTEWLVVHQAERGLQPETWNVGPPTQHERADVSCEAFESIPWSVNDRHDVDAAIDRLGIARERGTYEHYVSTATGFSTGGHRLGFSFPPRDVDWSAGTVFYFVNRIELDDGGPGLSFLMVTPEEADAFERTGRIVE